MNLGRRQFVKNTASAPAWAAVQTQPKRRRIDAHVSSGDDWWIGDWLAVDSPESIAETVQMWADLFGMERIYWRGQQEEMVIDHQLIRKENFIYADYYGWARHLVRDVGVNKILVREAHKRRMEVHMWSPLFDFAGPADGGGAIDFPYQTQQRLTIDHPEWMPVDRYGFRRQNGPVAFCYPEARKAVIDMYLSYMDRDGYDAIAFFTYCENFSIRFDEEFGFNEPAVQEFRRRFGVDVRTQDYDRHLWSHLLGEYVTEFLRELRAQLRSRGKKIGFALNAREPNYPQPWSSSATLTAGRIYLDWEKWVREGLVDDIQVWCTRTPMEIQLRTAETCLDITRGTGITVGLLTGSPSARQYEGVVKRGARLQAAFAGEAPWILAGAKPATQDSIDAKNPYAMMRVLAGVIQNGRKIDPATVMPLARHSRVLMRRLALRALQQLEAPEALPVVYESLQDTQSSVRCAAVRALARINTETTVGKIAEAVAHHRQFQLFEAVSATLSRLDGTHLPKILALTESPDPLLRRLAIYVLGRRADAAHSAEAALVMLRCSRDTDAFLRFRAIEGLAAHCDRPGVVDVLIQALGDQHVSVQARAATSLALGAGPTAEVNELPWYNGILRTYRPPMHSKEVILNAVQQRVLDSLTARFREFGEGYSRGDADWGFRVAGNAMLAFGAEGRRQLDAEMAQQQDRRRAELAWLVVHVRQSAMNFEPIGNSLKAAEAIIAMRPTK